MAAEQHLVARSRIGPAQQGDQLVRAIAADDLLGLQAEAPGDAGAQPLRPAIGIAMEIERCLAEGGDGLGARRPSGFSLEESLAGWATPGREASPPT